MKNVRRIRLEIISLSVLFGFLAYILDVVLEYYTFHEEGFWNLLIFNVPPHELFMRFLIVTVFVMFGIFVSGLFSSRLNALSALSATEAKLTAILRCTGDAVIAADASGHISFMNQAAEKVTGWKANEASGRSIDDVFKIVDAITGEKAANPVKKVIKDGRAVSMTNHKILVRKDNSEILIGDSAAPVFNESGEIQGAVLVFRDESERKNARLEIKKSEQKFHSIIQTAPNVILQLSPDYKIQEFNPEAERIYGFKREEALGKDYLEMFVPEDDREYFGGEIKRVLSGEPSMGYKNTIITNGGRERNYLWSINRIPDTKDYPAGVTVTGYDITDRKSVNDSVRESEEKFRNVVDSSPMGMHFYRLEPNGRLIFEGANPAADKLLGLDNKQFIGKTIEEAFPGSKGTEIPERYRAAALDGETWQTEQVNYLDEKIKGAFQVVAFQTAKNRMVASFFDITEQKIIEKELKESEERFRSTFEQAAVGIAHVAPDGGLIRINQRFCDIAGYTREELLQRTFQDITHPDDVKRDIGFLRRMVSGDLKTHSIEKRYCRKDGTVVWVNLTTTLLRDQNNKPKYFISVIEDISNRKKAEETLKRTQFSVDRSVDAVFWVDPDAKFTDVNEAACKALGYSNKELLNMTVHDIDPNFPAEVWPSNWEELKRKGSFIIESKHKTKDGRIFPVEIALHYLKIDGKEYNCAFARDITDRKRAEEALKESEEKFRNVAEQSPNMIFINRLGKIVYVNNRCEEILGYNKEEFYSPNFDFFKLIAPEYIQMVKKKYDKHLKGEDVEPYEYALLASDGRKIEVIINTKIIRYEGEYSLLGIVTDITERKKAEELREKLIADLQKAAGEIKTLSGFIPICASCKKIRDDEGYWEQIETYIMERSDAEFSHGLCPECSKKLYPDF
ncbi:MAG: PAS domain S-box protein [Candidatus Zixiibacteriota bacterium]|nr:MAG: PAS domain S-box protein [candidate division Zixibacteria bacterium]